MEIINVVCNKCSGLGYINQKIIPNDDDITVKIEKDICDECNGAGHIEGCAVFSPEEARAILKHCGLTTES